MKKLKVYNYSGVEIAPVIGSYSINGNLAVQLIDIKTGDLYDVITVNLPEYALSGDKNIYAYVFAHDYRSYVTDFIDANKLGERTGKIAFSGYCGYPEYKFDLSKLNTKMSLLHYYESITK